MQAKEFIKKQLIPTLIICLTNVFIISQILGMQKNDILSSSCAFMIAITVMLLSISIVVSVVFDFTHHEKLSLKMKIEKFMKKSLIPIIFSIFYFKFQINWFSGMVELRPYEEVLVKLQQGTVFITEMLILSVFVFLCIAFYKKVV